MPSRLLALLLLLDTPEVIERVLAVVDGRPVLLSEVRTLGKVRGLSEDEAREALIDERLMFEQAARAPQAAVSSTEEDALYRQLEERSSPRLTSLSEAEVRRLVRREAAILKYVTFRFGSEVRVSDDDLQRIYAEEFGGKQDAPAFEVVEETLRARLRRRELDQRIEEWIKELRAGAEIRVLTPPAR
jgi:hypothetical protein